jgi:hypothetical protein
VPVQRVDPARVETRMNESEQVSNLISGTSSGDSKIIGNYKDFLYTEPLDNAKLYMNDYLTQLTSGRGSASSYIPNGSTGFGSGMGESYASTLKSVALKSTIEPVATKFDYPGNPGENLFADGFNNLDKLVDPEKTNNPWTIEKDAQQKFQQRLEAEQTAAFAESIAGKGMRSTKSGDTITTPGALIADNMANVMDLGNKIIAGSQSIPEAITAVVTQIITQSISSGIGKAAENVQREGNVSNWVNPDNQSSNNETSNSVDPATGQPYN